MKKIYFQCMFSCICLLILFFIPNKSIAQNEARVYEGILRIKVEETTASFLQTARMSRTREGYLRTGNTALDGVLRQSKATNMKRVFRHAGKYEAKHRAHGLHLWYEVTIDKSVDVSSAVSSYRRLRQIQVSEPVYEKEIIGYDRTMESMKVLPLADAPNDTQFANQWHYDNTGQTGGAAGADINLLDGWNIETGNSQVIIAVTDGGIDVDHEDIAANMWVNTGEIPGNSIDDDGNGYVDDVNGYGFGDDTGEIAGDVHGTHVGGTVAAVTNNGVGVSGVAGGDGSGNGVRLMSCAAFGAVGTGGFEETYTYGADNGAVISQNSWGYTSPGVFEQVVLDGIDYFIAEAGFDEFGAPNGPMQGGLVIFAAGNDGTDNNWYPGFYEPTFAVGGTDHNDDQYNFSNRGDWVDVAAPAVNVLSTLPNNTYGLLTGTSMACPHVSGLAALVVSRNINNTTPAQVRFLIESTTDPLPGLEFLGSGRINAFNALQVDDSDGPVAVADLLVADLDLSSVTLQWTAPSDVGSANASSYDIRYSTSVITEANFDAATAVASPPVPSPAGTAESFTIAGLTPSTEYYFAIKSEDFFNNVSSISNVVSATTDDVPVADVAPETLTSDLITGESEIQNLTLSNSGSGPLDFDISFTGDSYLSADITSGTVSGGGNQPIALTFDASGLFGGTYSNTVVISTNDPANPVLNVVTTLNVTGTGTPVISVSPESIAFADTFVGGTTLETITITNEGTEILDVTNITSSSADFVVASSTAFTLLPFTSQDVSVGFSPTALGALSGNIDITSNDATTPLVQVTVSGNGVDSPSIGVDPTSIEAELFSGNTTTEVLTITNNGVADLEFTATIAKEEETTSSVKINIAEKTAGKLSSADAKQKIVGNYAGMQLTSNVSLSANTISVMLLTADDDITDVESTLSAFPDLNVTRFPKASLPDISISDFDGIDVVMTTNNTKWLEGGGVSPVIIGDLLADYIDNGGKVITNCFADDYAGWELEGRFITDSYSPFTPADTDIGENGTLGTIHVSSHPVMNGIATIGSTYLRQNPGIAEGGILLADWSDGNHFAATNDNVLALNILPSNGAGAAGWTGDLATLYHNSIIWLSGGISFVSLDLEDGILAQGESIDINVTISAEGLDSGIYESGIEISSNDPVNSLVEVPVTLTVLGPPVTATPDSLESTLEKGQTETQIVTLTNSSDAEATYEVSIEDATIASVTTRIAKPLTKRMVPYMGDLVGANSTVAITSGTAGQLSTEQYATSFEIFALGDINDQDNWTGQFGNWTIETTNPSDGNQNFRGLADGFGQSLAFTPEVPVGSDELSSFSAMVQVQGSGVTWEIIPQSNTAELVNTRLRFNGDGSIDVLTQDDFGNSSFVSLPITAPSGYFSVGIEVERATSQFTIYIDGAEAYSGLGFAGDIEQVVILSLMETAGPVFDMDEVQIIDGGIESSIPYVTVSPESGTIPAGSSVDLEVTFDATEQDFGSFTSNIVVTVNEGVVEDVIIPATLNVIGDPSIFVDPTVVQEVSNYNVMSTRTVTIENTGGSPLEYDLTVIGADIGANSTAQVNDMISMATADARQLDRRISAKLHQDSAQSSRVVDDNKSLYITIGETIFSEDFDKGTFPPAGWNVIDNEGTGIQWGTLADAGENNYCGTGEAATVSSDSFGLGEFDTELISPAINIAGMSNLSLKYNVNYQNFINLDFLDLDVSIDGGATWTNVLRWNEDHGNFKNLPGEEVNISLDSIVAGADTMMLRWHYYDPNTGDFDWYAQIDDVEVMENTEVWLALDHSSGTVPVGGTAEVELQFDPTVVSPGFYVAGIIVNSNAANTPVVGVVVSMEELNAAEISVDPDSLEMELVAGRTGTQTLTISNSGESVLDFAFDSNFPNVGVAASTSSSGEQKENTYQIASSLTDARAIKAPSKNVVQNALEPPVDFSDVLYATNFEDFAIGDINGQLGWLGQSSSWQIVTSNPAGGKQHIRSISDGFGQRLAFSPEVAVGTAPISSTSMMVDLEGTDVTWQIIPQSISEGLVVTRLSFGPDGTASVLVDANGGEFQPITTAVPEGQFNVSIEVERATKEFTVYFDNTAVFTGAGFSGSIEQMVLLSLMEVPGPSIDIDNLQLVDGVIPELMLSVSPQTGSIPAGSSQDVTVRFDATNLLGGVYQENLTINSNDPFNEQVIVPTTLTVIDPQVIAVSTDSLIEVLAQGDMSTRVLTISNDGVADLNFIIDIEGELTIPSSPADHQISSGKDWEADSRIVQKTSRDNGSSLGTDARSTLVKKHGMVATVYEDFEGGTFPPTGWTVIDNEGTGVQWAFSADYNEGNYAGSGEAATVSSDDFGTAEFDTELRTPAIPVTNTNMTLQYVANYQNLAGLDFLDVDISTDNGATWTTMLSWNEDHGPFFSGPGETVVIELDSFLTGASTFMIRWHYYDPNTNDFDWYAQIDDVVIGVPWLSLSQASGTVPGGSSLDIEVNFDASLLNLGSYTSNLNICSDDLKNPEVDVPVLLTVITPANILLNPDTVYMTLYEGFEDQASFQIGNDGEATLEYNVSATPDFVEDVAPEVGEVLQGENQEVSFNITAEGLTPGSYVEAIDIDSNDPDSPTTSVVIDLTVLEFIVLDMEVEAVCSDNPDTQRVWKVTNPNDFEWDAFWFIIGSGQFDDISLAPGENYIYTSTLTDRPNTLKLRWFDEDEMTVSVVTESTSLPCEVLDPSFTSVCSNNPEIFRRWNVSNPNPFTIAVNWTVIGTSQSGMLYIDGNSDTHFYTEAIAGANTTTISWKDENGGTQELVADSSGELCDIDNSCSGGEVIAFRQGARKNGKPITSKRSIADKAIGIPEQDKGFNFVALGFGGEIVIRLSNIIADQPGNDFTVVETSYRDLNSACNAYPETADVYVSADGVEFHYVGLACKDTEFDIAVSGLMDIEYVKIVDTSDPSIFRGGNADGFDLDGIACINAYYSKGTPFRFASVENYVLDEPKDNDEVYAWPNPFKETLSVKMNVVEEKGVYQVRVYNIFGSMVYQEEVSVSDSALSIDINTDSFSKGTYSVVIFSGKNQISTTTLIKR